MPHARIVAESPERARLVAKQLALRGYSVDIVDPGIQFDAPADLEITVTADSPLPFFAEEVYAAPGSILGLVEYEPDEKPAPEYRVFDQPSSSVAGSMRIAWIQTLQAFADAWRSVTVPIRTRWAAYRASREQRAVAHQQRRAEAARLRVQQEEASHARIQAEQESAQKRGQQAEAARRANVAAQQERQRKEQVEAARVAALEAARRREQQQAETARLERLAQEQEASRRRAQAAEAARLAQIAHEQESARQRALELEQEQRAAHVAAHREEARRQAEQEQAVVARRREQEKRQREEFLVAEVRRLGAEERALAPLPAPISSSPAERRWQAAFAAAAAVSAIAVLGLFFGNDRRPAAPVSNQTVVEAEAVEQQVPFGAATALPAETVLKKAATPSSGDAPRPRPQPRQVFRADTDQYAGDNDPEVVIRRRSRPPQAGEQASRVKRITDEEADDFEEEELE